MDEREFTARTTAGATSKVRAPASTKAGDKLGGLVVLYRRDTDRGDSILVLGPPKEESTF